MKMPVYSTDSEEKHRIISELGIKYFTDNYNNLASYPKNQPVPFRTCCRRLKVKENELL
jgi:hypothetical protein